MQRPRVRPQHTQSYEGILLGLCTVSSSPASFLSLPKGQPALVPLPPVEQRDICSDTLAARAPPLGLMPVGVGGETPQRGRASRGWGLRSGASRGLAWGPLATLLMPTLHHSVLRFEDISLEL